MADVTASHADSIAPPAALNPFAVTQSFTLPIFSRSVLDSRLSRAHRLFASVGRRCCLLFSAIG